ncbi:DeoR family transcriptional regulator [Psychromonas sp.]|uniref:DeoR family transcriptional regulator n=1 Tax=Psychromonas sp. TaxID=1884585 RepID=UPI0035617770
MIPAERHRAILALLSTQEVVSIHQLTEQLDVSHMTIRRDIGKLEADGQVISVSGGVQLTESIHTELSHDIKTTHNQQEKINIGKSAASLIKPNMTIYLDAGTTTLEIAHNLVDQDDIMVVTNDFVIAAFLMKNSKCKLYFTGGKVDRENQSCVGNKAAYLIKEINMDIAFISTSSWGPKGLSTPSEDKVYVKQSIVKSAKVNCLVSDSSKYGKRATFHALDIGCFDSVITDSSFPRSSIKDLAEQNVEVIIC